MSVISSTICRVLISRNLISRNVICRILLSAGLLANAAIVAMALAGPASAQDRRQNAPGEFDFYVLSLSWSPSSCEAAAERATGRSPRAQCGERPFSFVVPGCGRNTSTAFPTIVSGPRRGST